MRVRVHQTGENDPASEVKSLLIMDLGQVLPPFRDDSIPNAKVGRFD
jgi:hypothetical protein